MSIVKKMEEFISESINLKVLFPDVVEMETCVKAINAL